MSRKQTHATLSLVVVLIVLFGTRFVYQHPYQFWISSVLLVFGSLFPDIIEPARHFTHRRFFHSKILFLIFLIMGVISFVVWLLILKSQYILYLIAFIFGYLLHLLLDATTKLGLPSK